VLHEQHRRGWLLGCNLNDAAHGGIRAFNFAQVLRADADDLGEQGVGKFAYLRVAGLNCEGEASELKFCAPLLHYRQAGYLLGWG
jgi:hypothetical protein